MIRKATSKDVQTIVDMSDKFFQTTDYNEVYPMDPDTVWDLVEMLMASSVMLVAEVEGQVVGMVGALISPGLFNRNITTACEIVWWVDPTAGGAGIGKALLATCESECRIRGAKTLQMVKLRTSPEQAAMIYERNGFRHSESSYTKVL